MFLNDGLQMKLSAREEHFSGVYMKVGKCSFPFSPAHVPDLARLRWNFLSPYKFY